MPFNGAGTFTPAVTFVAGGVATASDQNEQDGDIATGLSNCMTRDGQSPPSGNIPMGGFKITDVGAGVVPTDAANMQNVASVMPTGAVLMYGASVAPTGFLPCDGGFYSRTTYATLFSVIGTTWGVGDGLTTFNVPDMRGRAPIGVGQGPGLTSRILAASGGEESHLLTTPEIPSHTHVDAGHSHIATDSGHSHLVGFILNAVGGGGSETVHPQAGEAGNYASHSGTANVTIANGVAANRNTGGGGVHNNMQPWAAINFIIKT